MSSLGTGPIVPITQTVYVDGEGIKGNAIALHHDGNSMLYLVVVTGEKSPPVWVSEHQLKQAVIQQRAK
jgi:hypothetical protein